MPIYEYKCRGCGHVFEELVKVGQTPNCPSCDGDNLEQLLSLPAISTESTRARSKTQARATGSRIRREQEHARAEATRNYIRDHGD